MIKSICSKKGDVSVVIATLGLEPLKKVIESLNEGTIAPVEILICIPEDCVCNLKDNYPENVKIISTKEKGQVAQRIVGFTKSSSPYVLQIDDDVILNEDTLELLINCINHMGNVSVGPKIYDLASGKYHTFLVGSTSPSLIERFFFYIINGKQGYQPGKISLAGVNMGTPESSMGDRQIDWLAGGCILHKRENLILGSFYPFKGKAYAEDIFHSIELRRNGVSLYRCDKARVEIDFSGPKRTVSSYFQEHIQNYKVRKEIVNRISGSTLRLKLFTPLDVIRIIFRKLRS